MVVDTKLYDILEIQPDASEQEIRKKFKIMAKQYHPDKAGPEFEEKFKEVNFAHEVLSNPEKRQIYDRYGPDGLSETGGAAGMEDLLGHIFGGGGGFGGMGGMGGMSGMGGLGSMMGGPFGMMGGMMGGGRRPQRRKGEDTAHPLKVTLEDLFNGKSSKLKLKKKVICGPCKGAGGKSGAVQTCTGCRGQGMRIEIQQVRPGMVQQVQRVCPDCQGEGEMISEKNRCKTCYGKKVVEEAKILEVEVAKGSKDNQKITFRGEGDQQPGIEAGDVIIVLQQQEHEKFTRKGDNLLMTLKISLTEALCGFKIPLQQLDKRELLITNPPGHVITPGCQRCIIGEGMPQHRNPHERGNLIITFAIGFPEEIDTNNVKTIESLLPKRDQEMVDRSDEVTMKTLKEYYPEDNDNGDDEEEDAGHGHGHGGPGGVQCATQ